MVLDHFSNTDVRGGTINSVGRDQTHTTINNIQISFSLLGSRQPRHVPHNFVEDSSRQATGNDIYSEGQLLISGNRSFDASSIIDIGIGLIVQTTHLLLDRKDTHNHRDLTLELKSLHQTLTLTGLAIKEYEGRPLGQSLASMITPEAEQCYLVLQELLERVAGTWVGLNSTSIANLWRPVWWGRWDGDELASLRKNLSNSRRSLEGFLMALHSVSWMILGNELQAGHVPLARFHTLLTRRLPFLGHIKLNTVTVVSHLGDIIPVPNIFCSNWKDFHYIIDGHCKGRFGNRFVARGDYMLIRADDNRVLHPSEFTSQMESGMVVEMSIVLRADALFAFEDDKCKCPRCGHINSDAVRRCGWIKCRGCPGQFQIARIDEPVQTAVSPALDPEGTNSMHQVASQDLHQCESVQFFRRIHLVVPIHQDFHSTSPPATIQDRQLDREDALAYLDAIKAKVQEHTYIYNHLLGLMKDFKNELIDTPGVIRRVAFLFYGYPELIQGFNTFLPPGYRIDARRIGFVNATSPTRSAMQIQSSKTSPSELGPLNWNIVGREGTTPTGSAKVLASGT